MPRFAILTHDHPELHWDLLLETGGVLRTWRLATAPAAGGAIAAVALPDHRLTYLEYEGPVPGGRGSVARWDGGTYAVELWGDRQLEVTFAGERIHGRAIITHVDGVDWEWEYRG